ncbi:MAG: hypothetical protein WCD51_11325, partial [Anaerolineae bacterium]
LGTIPPGQTAGFDISALVDPLAPAVEITNTAVVSMPYDTDRGNNIALATNLILPPIMADLELQKTASTSSPTAGTSMNFTLLVTNHGPVAAENVVVEDMLPEGLTVQSVSPGPWSCTTGTPGSEPLRCNLGTLAVNAPATVVVTVGIDPDYVGTLENDAVVFSDTHDQNNSNNRDFVIVNVTAYSSVFLKKGCGFEEEVLAGEEIQYDILVRNNGPSTVHNFELWDLLPDDVTYLSYEILPGGGQCFYTPHLPPMHGGDGPGLHCYLGDVAPTETRIVYITVRVNPDAPEGELTNRVTDWDAESSFSLLPPAPSNRECSNIVVNRADLSIRKTADPYKVYAGEQVRYDVSVTNNGPSVAYTVTVTDTLDPGVEYEIDTIGCAPMAVGGEGVMLGSTGGWYGSLLVGLDLDTAAPTVRGSLPDFVGADIEYDALSGKLYASMGGAWDEELDSPQLHTIDPETGDSLGFVELDQECALPALEFVGSTLYATCHSEGHSGDSYLVTVDPTTGHVTTVGPTNRFRIHGLAYDGEAGVMYGVTYHDEDAGDLVSINLGTGAASTVCSTDREDITGLDYGPGGILYAGIGGDHGTDRELLTIDTETCDMTLVGETGLDIVGLTWPGGDGAALNCELGDIPPGETRNFSIWARVKPDTVGMINNRVDVFSETGDPNPNNDWDTEASLVLGRADLRVQKFGKPEGEVRAGDKLTYTVIVDNLGTGYAHDVTLDDVMESNGSFDLLGVTSARDMLCDEVAGTFVNELLFTCVLTDPLEVKGPAPGSGRWMLTITVQANEPQSINNRADADSSDYDPDMSNNWDIAEHEITAVADLALTKEAWGEMPVGCEGETELWLNEVAAGGMVTYTLTVSNTGPSTAENVMVLDEPLPLPDLLEINVQSITPSQGNCQTGHIVDQGRLSCNLGTILPGESANVTFAAHVPSWVQDYTVLVNDAQAYSDMFDDNNGNDIVSNQTVVSRVADLEVGKTQDPKIALPGQDITYTIVVTNTGPSDAQGVIISDTLPVEVLNPTWTCCASDGECDVPCEPPVCPPGECPWPDIGLFAQADIPAGELVIYTVEGVLDVWPCPLPITNTVEIIAPLSLVHPELDIDPCDDNNVAEAVNKVPFCTYDPLILKQYPGPDSP